MGETVFPYPSQQNKSNKKKLAIIIGAIVLVIAIVGGVLISQQPKKTVEDKVAVTETPTPSPTESPKIDKATVKIQVINGTGTPGQAGKVIKTLEEAGYSADNIKTGNAEKFDNLSTTITARENFDEIVSNIKEVLKSTFDEIVIGSPRLDASSEFDIVIVTGGKIFETITPTASASSSQSPTSTPTTTPTASPTPTL